MVKAELRVKTFEYRENPVYGSVLVESEFSENHYRDFDRRDDIAPCGVRATIRIKEAIMDIFVSRAMLLCEDVNEGVYYYSAYFNTNDNVYELGVSIKDAEIKSVSLHEWFSSGDFEDGRDADNEYYSDKGDFMLIATIPGWVIGEDTKS